MSLSHLIDTLESRQLFSATPTVAGYLPDWRASQTTVNRIDYSAITTLNYFSVIPNASGKLPGADGSPANSMSGYSLSRLRSAVTAAKAHGVKVNIVIGGAGAAPTNAIQSAMSTAAKRTTFAKSIAQFCKTYKLDGVDIDYEPSGPSDAQITRYGKLLKEVNANIGTRKLTVAVAAETLPDGDNWDDRRYVLNAEAVRNVDQIGVMAYDFTPGDGHSGWDRSFDALNDWGTYANQKQAGAKHKLLLGLPFYGRAGSDDWSNPGVTGEASYGDIARAYAAASPTGALPPTSADNVAAKITGQAENQTVQWYYNGPDTIAAKSANAMWSGAGGVMIWDLSQDYFTAAGQYDQAHSLLPAVERGLDQWAASANRSGRRSVAGPPASTPTAAASLADSPLVTTRVADDIFGRSAIA